jgi:DNA-binding NarL/FixJ family response regulator
MEPARPSKLRVLLVDDHRVVADALAKLIAAEPDLEVVGTAASVDDIERGPHKGIDCALISYLLRDGTAAVATRVVKRLMPHARVVVMSRIDDEQASARVARAGADAFIDGNASAEEMLSALRGLSAGILVSKASAPARRIGRRHGAADAKTSADRLTPRELEVLRALALGRTTRQMCAELGIGNNTVRTHVQNVIAKLRVHSRLEAVALARRERIV